MTTRESSEPFLPASPESAANVSASSTANDQDRAWFSDERDQLAQAEDTLGEDDLRYSVASLMIATALVALSIAMLKLMSLFGVVLIVVAMWVSTKYLNNIEYPGRRKIAQGMWGIVLPALCILYDPGFLHESWYIDPSNISLEIENLLEDQRGMFLLPPIIWQCVGLAIWLLFARRLQRVSGVFCGFFHIGAGIAFLIGLCLFPFSCIGLLAAGLGLLGLTPFWTAYTYRQVGSEAYFIDLRSNVGKARKIGLEGRIALGVLLALVVPLLFSMWATGMSFGDLMQGLI